MSLDRVRVVRTAKRSDLGATLPPYSSAWTGACTRLMQIQMAALFFYSAISKLGREEWLNGSALWVVFTMEEYYSSAILNVLASHFWLANLATYGTILIELAFPFLIWQQRTRPYLLAAALFLHAQFAVLMGLLYFSFVMMMGHMSFVRPGWLIRLGLAWKRRMGDMEMIYDGRCGFCVRSMAWFLAFEVSGRSRYGISARILRPWSATRKWRRRSTWSWPTDGRCPGSRPIDTSCCACRDCGGRFRSFTCRCSAVLSGIQYTSGSPATEVGSRLF
jgi:hypothetical protein